MDVSTGTFADRNRANLDFARRGRGLAIGEGSSSVGGVSLATGTGGLLETFDAVFKSAIDSTPPLSADRPLSDSSQSVSETAQQPESDVESDDENDSETSSSDRGNSASSLDASKDLNVGQLATDQTVELEEASGESLAEETNLDTDAKLPVVDDEDKVNELESELQEVDVDSLTIAAGALQQLSSQPNENDTSAVTEADIETLAKPVAADPVKQGVDAGIEAQVVQPALETDGEGEQEFAGTLDGDAAGKKVLAADGEPRNNDRGRRIGARYNDRKAGPASAKGEAHGESQASDGRAVNASSVPDELIKELSLLENGDSQQVPAELQLAAVESPQPATSANITASANVNSSVAGVLPAGGGTTGGASTNNTLNSEAANTETRINGTESVTRRDDGVRGITAEGKSVQGGSNEAQVRLVQRVSRAFQRLGPDGGRVNIMLHPAELGSVKLELQIDGQTMTAKMIAESETAASVLRENLPELKQKLADAGMLVQNIDLQVADQQSGSSGGFGNSFGTGNAAQHGRDQDGRGGRRGADARSGTVADKGAEKSDGSAAPLGRRTSSRGSLDLRF